MLLIEKNSRASGGIGRLSCKYFSPCEHRRCDAAALMDLGDNHRDEMQHDGSRQGIEGDFVNFYKRRPEVRAWTGRPPYRSNQTHRVEWLRGPHRGQLSIWRIGFPKGGQNRSVPASTRPVNIWMSKKKQQSHADPRQRVVPNVLLWLAGQERCDIGSVAATKPPPPGSIARHRAYRLPKNAQTNRHSRFRAMT